MRLLLTWMQARQKHMQSNYENVCKCGVVTEGGASFSGNESDNREGLWGNETLLYINRRREREPEHIHWGEE